MMKQYRSDIIPMLLYSIEKCCIIQVKIFHFKRHQQVMRKADNNYRKKLQQQQITDWIKKLQLIPINNNKTLMEVILDQPSVYLDQLLEKFKRMQLT